MKRQLSHSLHKLNTLHEHSMFCSNTSYELVLTCFSMSACFEPV